MQVHLHGKGKNINYSLFSREKVKKGHNPAWFKRNLTLFKSHISHMWENMMNLFEDIYDV